jgi:hypothetical protein
MLTVAGSTDETKRVPPERDRAFHKLLLLMKCHMNNDPFTERVSVHINK